MHRDLPDEQGVRSFRDAIAGDAAEQIAVAECSYRGVPEMAALQQVAIQRIGVKRGTGTHQPVQRNAIGRRQNAKFKWDGIVNR
ncbi:MAG: hypothetical protein WCA64_06730 [Gallionella sp.]